MLPTLRPSDETFGTLLRRYRERAGLGRNELARAAGLDPSYVGRLENGERPPAHRRIVLEVGGALELDAPDADRLMILAGYAPLWLMALARVARVAPRERTA